MGRPQTTYTNKRKDLKKRAAYSFQNADGFFTEPHGIKHVIVEDGLKKVVLVVSFKRRLTGHHFIHENAQSPPINRRAVLQLLQDLNESDTKMGFKMTSNTSAVGYVHYDLLDVLQVQCSQGSRRRWWSWPRSERPLCTCQSRPVYSGLQHPTECYPALDLCSDREKKKQLDHILHFKKLSRLFKMVLLRGRHACQTVSWQLIYRTLRGWAILQTFTTITHGTRPHL